MSPLSPDLDLRTAFFVSNLRMGGAERMMVNLAVATAELGLPVDLVVADTTDSEFVPLPMAVVLHDLGVSCVRSAVVPLTAYLRRRRPYALISRVHKTNVVAVAAVRLSRTPTRIALTESTHLGGLLRESSPMTRLKLRWGLLPLMRWSYARADALVAVSQGVADELSRRIGIGRRRISVIRNPVVDERLLRLATEPPAHPWLHERTAPVILAVGGLRPAKDFATLLRAFGLLLRRRDARLLIYGTGCGHDELLRLRHGLGLESSVDLPGATGNPFAAMSASDLFVLSSSREGSPNVLVEALACGCRVVATDCCTGPSEILQEGTLGPLVPVGDAAALADAIDRRLDAPPPGEDVRTQIRRDYSSRTAALNYLAAVAHPAIASDFVRIKDHFPSAA